jgi:HTH-type transcriptional regulator/antitoxin HigA
MAKTPIRPIRSKEDYEAALEEIEQYFEREPKPGTPDADRFDLLALVIEDYEKKHWPIEAPDAVEAIRYRMQTGGFTQTDLGRVLGSRQRASEILARKRPVTMEMAWKLHCDWDIPAEALIYPQAPDPPAQRRIASSAILDIDYDDQSRTLYVTFVGGKTYAYDRVPRFVYESLASAPSRGTYFNKAIRDQYPYAEVAERTQTGRRA